MVGNVIRERVRRELMRAPTGGVTRGELAVLLIDLDDDDVERALAVEIGAGLAVRFKRSGEPTRYRPPLGA